MPNTTPTTVLVNLATGSRELARACAGDAALRVEPFDDIGQVASLVPQARVLVSSTLQYDARTAAALRRDGRSLAWIFCPNAGLETFARHGIPPSATLSHAPGRAAAQVAEHGMALLLGLARAHALLERQRQAAAWDRERVVDALSSLAGRHLVIVGFGAIGGELARRARAFGMHVTGVATRARSHPDAHQVVAAGQLDAVLPQADALVLAVPHTAITHRLIDRRRLGLLQPSAVLVNLARGGVLDQTALVEALRARRIAGAALDVFDPEPLPAGHALWSLDNVLLSPHVAGVGGPREIERRIQWIRQQLLDFCAGRPPANPVDPARLQWAQEAPA